MTYERLSIPNSRVEDARLHESFPWFTRCVYNEISKHYSKLSPKHLKFLRVPAIDRVIEKIRQQSYPSHLKIDMPRTDSSAGEAISSAMDIKDFVPPREFRKRKYTKNLTKDVTIEDMLSLPTKSRLKCA